LYGTYLGGLQQADTPKKLRSFEKRASPLSPDMRECVRLVPKIEALTHAICNTGSYDFVFVPGHHPKIEIYTNPFPCHIQPQYAKEPFGTFFFRRCLLEVAGKLPIRKKGAIFGQVLILVEIFLHNQSHTSCVNLCFFAGAATFK
jgi:hypothetical protein